VLFFSKIIAMKKIVTLLLLLISITSFSQQSDTLVDPVMLHHRPWRAAAEVVGLNIGVWGFNHFIMNESFADISWASIKKNLETGFVWDNDQFSTNMFSHPYHGNLYFNSARCNGMSFGVSSLYAFGGSMMWELFMETEPPSINDVFATTLGGIALGEMTYRLSGMMIDSRKRGWPRVWNELAVTAISPMRGLNRMIDGEWWQVKPVDAYDAQQKTRLRGDITLGTTYLAADGKLFHGVSNFYGKIHLQLGDPIDDIYRHPYDFFTFNFAMNFGGQTGVSNVNLIGTVWGKNIEPAKGHKMLVGVFQHFDYISTDTIESGPTGVPVQMSGAAVVGGGMIYRFPELNDKIQLQTELYANAVLLGGTHSDYFSVIERDYNLGSGYSVKMNTSLEVKDRLTFKLNYHLLHLYTWINEVSDIYWETGDLHYLDVQGVKGKTRMQMFESVFQYYLSKKLRLELDFILYLRDSYYDNFDDVEYNTMRANFGLMLKL